jgi:hypothetical protein
MIAEAQNLRTYLNFRTISAKIAEYVSTSQIDTSFVCLQESFKLRAMANLPPNQDPVAQAAANDAAAAGVGGGFGEGIPPEWNPLHLQELAEFPPREVLHLNSGRCP